MKKIITLVLLVRIVLGLTGCGKKEEDLSNYNKYTYGKVEVYIPKDLTLGEGKDLNGVDYYLANDSLAFFTTEYTLEEVKSRAGDVTMESLKDMIIKQMNTDGITYEEKKLGDNTFYLYNNAGYRYYYCFLYDENVGYDVNVTCLESNQRELESVLADIASHIKFNK